MSNLFSGILKRLQRKSRTLIGGSFRMIGTLIAKRQKSLSGSLRFLGALSWSVVEWSINIAGNLRFVASLKRFLRRSKTLTSSLRMSGKIYTLKESLYYGSELGLEGDGVTAHNLLSATHLDTLVASVVAGDVIIGNATPAWTKLAKGTDGQFLKLVSGLPAWATGGATTFLALTDTPASYSGQTLKVVRVNAGETALEFATITGSPGGSDTQVQFNDGGAFGGNVNLTFDKTTGRTFGGILKTLDLEILESSESPTLISSFIGSSQQVMNCGYILPGSIPLGSSILALTPSDGGGVMRWHKNPSSKGRVKAASTGNLTLFGEQTIDGISCVNGDRVLVKNQTYSPENGVWMVAAGDAWGRDIDMNSWDEIVSALVIAEQGTTQKDTAWLCTSDSGGTLGTTAINWAQFGAGGAGNPGGSDTQVQFNDGGVFGGDIALVWDKTNDRLTIRNSLTSNMPWTSTQPLPPLGFALGVGSSGSPVSTMKLVMGVEKWSNADIIGANIPDQTAQFTLEKSAGTAAGTALMGFGRSSSTNTGDIIGTAGFAYNHKTSGGGNIYGGWFAAIDYGQQGNYLIAAEFDVRPQIDRGHKTAVVAGLSVGCWVGGAGYPYSWAFGTGVETVGGQAHTGLMITQDSIVPTAAYVNEAVRIRGGSAVGTGYGGIILTDYLTYGLNMEGATIAGQAGIVLGASHYIFWASTPNTWLHRFGNDLYYCDGTTDTKLNGGGGGAPVDATYVTLSTNATLTNERVLTGTANQIIISDGGAGAAVTLSTPQNIHTGAGPTFDHLHITGGIAVGGEIHLPNVTAIYMNEKNAMYFNESTIVIGAGSTLSQLYIAGVAKFLSVDVNGFVKAA